DVIEVLIAPGDTVELEQSLITVESDKASMEIPAETAGVVREVIVSVGDKVSEGSLIARIEPAAREAASEQAPTSDAAAASAPEGGACEHAPTSGAREGSARKAAEPSAPSASQDRAASPGEPASEGVRSYQGAVDQQCDVVVMGAGPGGYSAAFRAADLGLHV